MAAPDRNTCCGRWEKIKEFCRSRVSAIQEMSGNTENQLLQNALRHHQADRFSQASAIYRKILKRNPAHSGALQLFGTLCHQAGNNEKAAELLGCAIRIAPSNPFLHNYLGTVHQELNMRAEAIACFRKALALQPEYADARHNLAVTLQAQPEISSDRNADSRFTFFKADAVDVT